MVWAIKSVIFEVFFYLFFLQFLICTDVAARGLDVKGQLMSKDIFFIINSSKKRELTNLHKTDPEVKSGHICFSSLSKEVTP